MRKIFYLLILMIMVIFSALGVVHSQYKSRKLFVELQHIERIRDNLITEFGQLQLEQSTWAAHGRVESIAREQLKMYVPEYENTQYIKLER